MSNRRCPVCRRAINRTMRGAIARHTDTIGIEVCPMSGELYELAENGAAARVWLPTRNGVIRDFTEDVA